MPRNGVPIIVAGVTYSSMDEACRATGVSRSRMRYWSNGGEEVSADMLEFMQTKGAYSRRCIPVIANGVRYSSINEAAVAIGVSKSSLHARHTWGTMHKVGVYLEADA